MVASKLGRGLAAAVTAAWLALTPAASESRPDPNLVPGVILADSQTTIPLDTPNSVEFPCQTTPSTQILYHWTLDMCAPDI